MTDHGLPRALYNAFPWAPRGSSSQSLEDEALLSMDEVTPGAFVMITVLVVTIVICSPSGVISLVCVVVVWDELGSGKAGVEGIDTPGAAEAFAPPWTVQGNVLLQERSPQRRRPGSSAAPALDGGGHGRVGLGVSTRACVRNPQPGHRVVPRDRNPAARDIDGRAGPIIRSHRPCQGLGHGWVGFGRVRVRSRGTRLPQGITTGGAHVYSLGRRGHSLGRGVPGRRARPILGGLFAPIWTRHGCARGRGEPGAKVELRPGNAGPQCQGQNAYGCCPGYTPREG